MPDQNATQRYALPTPASAAPRRPWDQPTPTRRLLHRRQGIQTGVPAKPAGHPTGPQRAGLDPLPIRQRRSLKSRAYLAALLLAFVTANASAAVWVSQHTWSDDWEAKFAEWVEHNWHTEIYSDPASPYEGNQTDCADACYDMRAIFAYEHGLPFVITARGPDGKRISNEMRTWDHLPQEQRLKAFLDYVHNRTTSESIAEDTYPIPMTREAFKPGVIYVEPKSHCFQVVKISEYGVPTTLSSTVPRVARELYPEHNFPSFVPSDTKRYWDGYRRFRWPEHIGLPMRKVPGFSDEQYRLAESKGLDYIPFTDALLERLGSKAEPAPMRAQRFMYNLCYYARQRVDIVQGALDHVSQVQAQGRRCLNPAEYYDHSTDSRDRRLKEYFLYVRDLIDSPTWDDKDWTNNAYRTEWYLKPYAEAIFRPEQDGQTAAEPDRGGWSLFRSAPRREAEQVTEEDLIAWCGVEYRPGERISLREIWQGISRGTFSPDPHAPREHRWGLVDTPYQPSCRQY
jgi:hypothetical protein